MAKKLQVFQVSKVYNDGMHIPFSEIFGKNLKDIEDFVLTTKRTYSNNVEFFCEENNKLIEMDVDNEIITNYLLVKFNIDSGYFTSQEMFIDALATDILKPWFVETVGNYSNRMYDEYCEDIDSNLHNDTGKLNPSLVFTNEHSKIIYHMACLFRFVCPLATHFIFRFSNIIANQNAEDFFKDQYGNQIKTFQNALERGKLFNKTEFLMKIAHMITMKCTNNNPNINIYGKLNHYILSMIRGTSFSDQEMWSKLAMRNTSKYTLADVIMTKILIDIIPKSSFKKSAIKFIATTIETNIKWALTQHFKIHYNMIQQVSEDSDFTDADRFEINAVKTNEQKKIFADNFMDDTINIIFQRAGFILDPKEYEFYYNSNDEIHELQQNMLRLFFSKEFGGWSNLDSLNKSQYTRLLCFLIHYMKKGDKFKVLTSILTGRVTATNDKRILPRPISRKIKDSMRYQNIMDNYTYTGDTISKSNVIEKYIMFIIDSEIVYNEYKGQKNGQIIQTDLDVICDEYLKFIELLG